MNIPKQKQKNTNLLSPYLNAVPEPVIPWTELEKIKWHNKKVKTQKMRKEYAARMKNQIHQVEVKIFYSIKNNSNLNTLVMVIFCNAKDGHRKKDNTKNANNISKASANKNVFQATAVNGIQRTEKRR